MGQFIRSSLLGGVVMTVALIASLVAVSVSFTARETGDEQDMSTFARRVSRHIVARFSEAQASTGHLVGAVHGAVRDLPAQNDSTTPLPLPVVCALWDEMRPKYEGLLNLLVRPAGGVPNYYPTVPVWEPRTDDQVSLFMRDLRRYNRATLGGPLTLDGLSAVTIFRPVYNITLQCSGANDTCTEPYYWGYVAAFFSVDAIANEFNFIEGNDMFTVSLVALPPYGGVPEPLTNWTDGTVAGAHDEAHEVVPIPVYHRRADANVTWQARVRRRQERTGLTRSQATAAAVICSILGGLVIGLAYAGGHAAYMRVKEARQWPSCAPRGPPFAVVAVHLDSAEEAWATAPAETSLLVQSIFTECQEIADEEDAYASQPVSDGALVAAKTARAAWDVAARVAGLADRLEWPEAVRLRCDSKGATRPQLRVVVHWCREAQLRVVVHWCREAQAREAYHGGVEYAGADVELAVSLLTIAPLGRITLTPQFRRAATSHSVAQPSELLSLGTSIPGADGTVFAAHVVRMSSEGPGTRPVLDPDDAAVWCGEPLRDSHSMSNMELLSGSGQNQNQQRQHGHGGVVVRNPNNDTGEAGGGLGDSRGTSGNRSSGDEYSTVPAAIAPGAPRASKASAQVVVASKNALVERVLAHTVFARNSHAPWLPARTCEPNEIPKLHTMLQDQVTTPAEAQHYGALLSIAAYCFQAFQFVLRPLPAVEQAAIMRRLQAAFGVPERHFLHRLAAQVATITLRQLPEAAPPAEGGDRTLGTMYTVGDGTIERMQQKRESELMQHQQQHQQQQMKGSTSAERSLGGSGRHRRPSPPAFLERPPEPQAVQQIQLGPGRRSDDGPGGASRQPPRPAPVAHDPQRHQQTDYPAAAPATTHVGAAVDAAEYDDHAEPAEPEQPAARAVNMDML